MNLQRIKLVTLFVILFTTMLAHANYWDTGTTTFRQCAPYASTTFTGRFWGDEFESWYRTSDGYTFVKVYDQGKVYFYYAQLDVQGEFQSSGKLVGIDTPPVSSYMLERSIQRHDYLVSLREEAFSGSEAWAESTRTRILNRTLDDPVVEYVGLLLVHFANTNYDAYVDPPDPYELDWPTEPFAVVDDQFNSVEHTFQHPDIVPPNLGGFDDNSVICGGFKDYWLESSHYTIEPVCTIINPWVQDGNPANDQWLILSQNCEYYTAWPHDDICDEALQTAADLDWFSAAEWNDATHQIIILNLPAYPYQDPSTICGIGGPAFIGGRLVQQDGQWYSIRVTPINMIGADLWNPNEPDWMHIGLASHEWGHLIGLTYPGFEGGGNLECGMHGLMGTGNNMGARRRGECPSRLRAPDLIKLGIADWLQSVGRGGIIDITEDRDDVVIPSPTPLTHTIARREVGGQTFLIESIDYANEPETWDSYIAVEGHEVNPPPMHDNDLMVWRYNGTNISGVRVIEMGWTNGDWWNFYPEWQGRTFDQLPGAIGRNRFCSFPVAIPNDPEATPTSRIGMSNPPTTNSEFAILNVRGSDYPSTAQVMANFRVDWPWNLSENDTLYAPFILRRNITVHEGGVLTILPSPAGSNVACQSGYGIMVEAGARIVIQGTANAPIVFTSSQQGQEWSGIVINSDDPENLLDYCVVNNADIGVVVRDGYAQVTNSTIENCSHLGMAWINSGGLVASSFLQDNARFGAYVIGGNPIFRGNEISGNGAGGLRFWRSDTNLVRDNQIFANGDDHPESGYWAGMQVISGGVVLKCNSIRNNEGPGLMLFGQTFAEMMDHGGLNNLTDNMQAEDMDVYGEMTLMGGSAAMACGGNTLFDANDALPLVTDVYEAPEAPLWNVTQNYWGTTNVENIAPRLPNGAVIEPLLEGDLECGPSMPICFEEPVELMFWNGWHQEREALFADAIATYELLIELYPDKPQAQIAIGRLEFCKEAQNYSWSEIRDYFLDLAADSSKDSTLVILCKSNAAWCLAEMGDYDGAYAELDSLLDHADDNYEKMTVALQKLLVELKEDEYNLLDAIGSAPRGSGTLDEALTTWQENFRRIDLKVDSVLYGFAPSGRIMSSAPVPAQYALYQNYPNPFNPRTEIRFDLPEQADIELTIFNTLGQRVATLIDEPRVAGAYRVQWDGSAFASGVYLYQLKAGEFVETKKMVMMK